MPFQVAIAEWALISCLITTKCTTSTHHYLKYYRTQHFLSSVVLSTHFMLCSWVTSAKQPLNEGRCSALTFVLEHLFFLGSTLSTNLTHFLIRISSVLSLLCTPTKFNYLFFQFAACWLFVVSALEFIFVVIQFDSMTHQCFLFVSCNFLQSL